MRELRGIEARYGAATALRDIALALGDGELVCVVGPNGAGKTTLINVISGIHRATAGSITLDGAELAHMSPHRFVDRGIALVPEGRRLFTTMTVRENLELGSYRPASRARRAELISQVCARFPVLGQCLDRAAGTLSGGQQQMLAIGRALMAQPKILLLDEPSLGLAPIIVLEMFDLIRKVNAEGTAVLLVEQNVAMAMELAERAYVLEEGRIVAEGKPDVLLSEPHIRRAYLGLEAEPARG